MIFSVGESVNQKCRLNFGTHSGIFGCAEVVAITILEIAYVEVKTHLVRSSSIHELNNLDIVVDIGGEMFNRDMEVFNACRPTVEKYASAGDVWEKYAECAIDNVANEQGLYIYQDEMQLIKEKINREIIIPVESEDNGKAEIEHMFSFIHKFLPSWFEKRPDYNDAFSRVEQIVFDILYAIIKDKISQIATRRELKKRFNSVDNGILEIPSQTMPWLEEVVSYNKRNNDEIKFVIFSCPRKGWAAQCVPPSVEEKFCQLISFPKEWAGAGEKTLPKLSGVEEATFCNNGCFLVRARTKNAIKEMCKIAMS